MRVPAIEHATAEFYAWEKHGRGTALACVPIQLEPDFKPFFFHSRPPHTHVDDSHRPTLLSRIASALNGKPKPPINAPAERFPLEFFPDDGADSIAVLRLTFPGHGPLHSQTLERFLTLIGEYVGWLGFEILATERQICFQFSCDATAAPFIRQQLNVHFPTVQVEWLGEDGLIVEHGYLVPVDFGLEQEFMRPIATYGKDALDPLRGIFGVIEHLSQGEGVIIQTLFAKTVNSWSESILRAVTDNAGEPFFIDAPEMLPLAKEKVQQPLFAATLRILVQGSDTAAVQRIAQQLALVLMHVSSSAHNALMVLPDTSYSLDDRVADIVLRQSHRAGMLLNVSELSTFVRFPSEQLHSKKLQRLTTKTKAAPASVRGSGVLLGTNEHQGSTVEVRLDDEARYKHVHLLGSTGTGKSTLLMQLALQDIAAGRGAMVLDPHGDLIDGILCRIPKMRKDDIILIDPSNIAVPIGLNILAHDGGAQPDVLAADIVAVFRRLSTSWGDQMNSVLSNAILAFLENTRQGTLIDLRRFLIEKPFRDRWLSTATDPAISYYWRHEYPLLKTSSIGPILTRLDAFLRPKQVRYMVAQEKMLNFTEIMNRKQVVLAKLSQGLIGAENSYLLGTFLVSKLHQAALGQQAVPAAERADYFLFIDEFQHYATPSMAAMLSGVRKYKLSMTLAHQDLQQLQRYDAELAHSVLTNTYTRICFRLGDTDAKRVQDGYTTFVATDFMNLPTGEAIARVGTSEHDFNLTTQLLSPSTDTETAGYITATSPQRYGTPRDVVEAYIAAHLPPHEASRVTPEPPQPEPAPPEPPPVKQPTEEVPSPAAAAAPLDDSVITRRAAQYEQSLHRKMQLLVKSIAEECGYTATIEAALQDGAGKVDVSLEKVGRRIACEISVTTPATWEAHNVEKCLRNGYQQVICCAPDAKLLQQLKRKLLPLLDTSMQAQVLFAEPAQLHAVLAPASAPQEPQTVKGRRIHVDYKDLSPEEIAQRQSIIKRIVGGGKKGER